MDTKAIQKKLSEGVQRYQALEDNVNGFIVNNTEIVAHISSSWESIGTIGFWKKYLKIKHKEGLRKKLVAKYLKSILSPSSSFVMNVETVKTWRNNFETPFASFKDDEIRKLYDTFISLKHDADFLEELQNKDEFLYYYFLSKISFIERNRDFFDGRNVSGPLDYPELRQLSLSDQKEINTKIDEASKLGGHENE